MEMKSIPVKYNQKTTKEIERLSKKFNDCNKSSFIRDAVEHWITLKKGIKDGSNIGNEKK